ncbi:MAG TPA: hypothetical protein VIL40_01575, partial [Thermaerobacter sp.]
MGRPDPPVAGRRPTRWRRIRPGCEPAAAQAAVPGGRPEVPLPAFLFTMTWVDWLISLVDIALV